MFGLFVLLGFLVPHHSLIITAWMATLGALLAAAQRNPRKRRRFGVRPPRRQCQREQHQTTKTTTRWKTRSRGTGLQPARFAR